MDRCDFRASCRLGLHLTLDHLPHLLVELTKIWVISKGKGSRICSTLHKISGVLLRERFGVELVVQIYPKYRLD